MAALDKEQPGFLEIGSVWNESGTGIKTRRTKKLKNWAKECGKKTTSFG